MSKHTFENKRNGRRRRFKEVRIRLVNLFLNNYVD